MSYATSADLLTRFGEGELLRLAMTPSGELDQATLQLALDDASALIDGYLGNAAYLTRDAYRDLTGKPASENGFSA